MATILCLPKIESPYGFYMIYKDLCYYGKEYKYLASINLFQDMIVINL